MPGSDGCFRAFVEYDPKPATETVRRYLVNTLDADLLHGFDLLASKPAFLELNAHIRTFSGALLSGDSAAAEAMTSITANTPSDEAMTLLVSDEYMALDEMVNREDVQAGFFEAHAASMPEGCAR
jgi:hypothetical protein